MKFLKLFSLLLISSVIVSSCQNKGGGKVDAEFEKSLQEKLINAQEGDIIELPEGNFILSRPLVLDGINNITIKGKGKDKTILNFKGQIDGAEGLRITANGTILEDFTILDAKGDCIKVQDAKGITFRRLKVGWTTEQSTSYGSYVLYPVQSENVLIEECDVFGSSDAGIYVGQSKNIVVRKNHVYGNVAGIEIENSIDADVYDNLSENNTGGVLVFDLPDIEVKNGSRCRIYNNKILNNNIKNFGPKGTAVSEIPAGTGIIIMATNQCQFFNNEIKGHNSISCAIVSYSVMQKPYKDTLYDPFVGGISIHDNQFEKGTGTLDKSVTFGQLFNAIFGDKVPDIVFDGSVNPAYLNADGTLKDDQKICIRNNGNVSFANLDMMNGSKNMSTNITKMDCTLPLINEVKLP
jgi:parallel beta-helix repeat protein